MNAHTSGLKRQAASVDSIAPILLAPASELLSCPLLSSALQREVSYEFFPNRSSID
jgi:hypothetical protein